MNYHELKEILQSENVYDELKENEEKIFSLVPELEKCKGFDQKNDWHIYDVYEHILHVIDKTPNNKCLRIAALFHDMGKPLVYKEDENKIGHFYNHWNESCKIFEKYENLLGLSAKEINLIKALIYYHDLSLDKMDESEIRNIVDSIGKDNINLLFELKRADLLSQAPKYHDLIEKINNQEKLTYVRK